MSTHKKTTSLGRPVNEQARQDRMTQILDGARRCFVERGFHASSTAQISAAAGVSVANLYQYYATKEVLISALVDVDLKRHGNLIVQLWATDLSPKAIRDMLGEIFLTEEGHQVAVLRAEIVSESARNKDVAHILRRSEITLMELLHYSICAAQADGRIASDLDPMQIAERLSLVFEGLMRLYVFSPEDGERLLERYYQQFAEILGLSA